jgi:hypothetical protein
VEHLRITLTMTGPTARRALVEGRGERYERLVADLI